VSNGGGRAGVAVAEAIGERAIVLWRTHVDSMPDEANAITATALADIHAAAKAASGAPWTLVLDEFGAVVATAANQALALLQRGRTHEGQVCVVTQSTADIEALTGQSGLLASLTDNFSAFIVHRQTSPESRDWLAKLMGTTALWQSTDQTSGHGTLHTGNGSRRRVREFRVSSDTFAELRTGEAILYTTLGPKPEKVAVLPVVLPTDRPAPRNGGDQRTKCEIDVHPASSLPDPNADRALRSAGNDDAGERGPGPERRGAMHANRAPTSRQPSDPATTAKPPQPPAPSSAPPAPEPDELREQADSQIELW